MITCRSIEGLRGVIRSETDLTEKQLNRFIDGVEAMTLAGLSIECEKDTHGRTVGIFAVFRKGGGVFDFYHYPEFIATHGTSWGGRKLPRKAAA